MRSLWKSKKILPLNTALLRRLEKKPLLSATSRLNRVFCLNYLKKVFAISLYMAGWFPGLKFLKKINVSSKYLHFWARSSNFLPMVTLPVKKVQVYNGLKFYSYSCEMSKIFFKIGDFVPSIYVGTNKFVLKNKKTVVAVKNVGAKKKV